MRRVGCVLVWHPVVPGVVLAVTRPRPPLRLGFPGGSVEWEESFEQGARRELAEETGVRARYLRLVHEGYSDGGRNAYVKLFEATCPDVSVVRSSPEGAAVWVPVAALWDGRYGAFPRYARAAIAALGRQHAPRDVVC
jgi:8-oxo-dGTP pyrophosphatase MutT (NUDIX family)